MHKHNSETAGSEEVALSVEKDLVTAVVQEVWESMLGNDLDGPDRDTPRSAEIRPLLGYVRLCGGWHGTVSLNCSRELARTLAGRMFGADPDSLTKEEVHDALGEVVNIIGGNLKHLFPPSCRLLLPGVEEDPLTDSASIAGRVVAEVGFVCGNETFQVSLVEAQGAASSHEAEPRREICNS
jgi:chemotaxis protein CheX